MVSISLCMIIKNEEAVLKRCLDSVCNLVDEIVIVDTGSTDNSKEIAAEYTDKIYDFEWVDDFSKARNYAFSKCTKDYIYSVDADEVLDEENQKRFLELKETIIDEIEIVQMWYVNTKEYATTENFEKELRPKLFKRLRKFLWIDPIHESVNLNPVVYDSDIEILHLPISNHAGRDFRTFEKAIARGERLSKKLLKMYARELLISGNDSDIKNASDYFNIAFYDRDRDDEEKSWCYVVLARFYRVTGNDGEFFKWVLKDVVTSQSSEICVELGDYYYNKDDYMEAICWFVNALNETEPILCAASHTNIPCESLSKCYRELAKCDDIMRDAYIEEAIFYESMKK